MLQEEGPAGVCLSGLSSEYCLHGLILDGRVELELGAWRCLRFVDVMSDIHASQTPDSVGLGWDRLNLPVRLLCLGEKLYS